MTSRERIRRLLKRESINRIPNGLGGSPTAGLHVLAYNRLKRSLGINDPKTRMYSFMANSLIEKSVIEAMNGDIIVLGAGKLCPARFWGPGSEKDWKNMSLWGENIQVPRQWSFTEEIDGIYLNGLIPWGNLDTDNEELRLKCPINGIYFDPVLDNTQNELQDPETKIYPDDFNPPHDIRDEYLHTLEDDARWLFENTEYSILCGPMTTDLEFTIGGKEAWWIRLIEEPDVVHEFLHKASEAALSQLRLLDQAVGCYADILQIPDDIGDSRGVLIGPDLWREIYKPHYKFLFTEWHKITNMKVLLHSCGSIIDILEDLIECGVDIVNPVQISARGMKPEKLKAGFGDEIIFYGGAFDAVQNPPGTTADIVYENVKRNISILSEGGGYIFAAVHNIPGNTPQSHIDAILNAYRDCNLT